MEEKILKVLKNKFSSLGLSDNILKGFAKKIAKTTTLETEIDAAVEGVEDELRIWQSINDQHRTEITALKKEITNSKKEAENKKGDDDQEKKDKGDTDSEVLKLLKSMQSEMSELKGEKIKTSRKEILETKIKAAPDAIKNKVLKDFSRMNFQNDEDFEAFVTETETDLSEITKAIPKPSTKPHLSIGGADVSQTRVTEAITQHAAKVNPKTN